MYIVLSKSFKIADSSDKEYYDKISPLRPSQYKQKYGEEQIVRIV